MNATGFLARRKTHLAFVGIFLAALSLNIVMGFTAGQTLIGSIWSAISELRPMDYLMFALFWYACAVHRPDDDWRSPLITLNLTRSKD